MPILHSVLVAALICVSVRAWDYGPTYGQDYVGIDYNVTAWHSPQSMSANHWYAAMKLCENYCLQDPRCVAWTYCTPEAGPSDPERCCLKNGVPVEVPANTHWTGLSPRAANWTGPPYPGPAHVHPTIHFSPGCLHIDGWHDIAGALYLQKTNTHHVFQGCPLSGGWHHATSSDLVHWEAHGIAPTAAATPFGFSSPCSGFATVDDHGQAVVGYRQCPSTDQDGVPLSIRVAANETMETFGQLLNLFPVYFQRRLPYDPVRPWVGTDGHWYATIALDACNRSGPACNLGGSAHMWTADSLAGPWRHIGVLFSSNRTVLPDRVQVNEFVTPDYFGNLLGDPRGGKTRVFTNNFDGYTMYFIGTQEDGGPFIPDQSPAALSALDWASFKPRDSGVGINGLALSGQQIFSMARTLSADPNQVVAPGRKVIVGWLQDNTLDAASMSLPRDLTLGPDAALRQAFVPELQSLRTETLARYRAGEVNSSAVLPLTRLAAGAEAMEIHACFNVSAEVRSGRAAAPAPFGVRVLACSGQNAHGDLLFDMARQHVVVDRSTTDGDMRAGPLEVDEYCLHAIVDHSIVEVIFGNRTAITAFIHAPDPDCTLFSLVGDGSVELASFDAWALRQANNFA